MACGSRMLQDAPGAVGVHGSSRGCLTLPRAAERRAPPRRKRLAILQRNGEIRGFDRSAAPCGLVERGSLCGVMLPSRSPCELIQPERPLRSAAAERSNCGAQQSGGADSLDQILFLVDKLARPLPNVLPHVDNRESLCVYSRVCRRSHGWTTGI